jgi:hypothetical protein
VPRLQLSYPAILRLFGAHMVKERTESRALLAWFLENYYRLDEMEVGECICDGRYDKGIDGIYVNDQLGTWGQNLRTWGQTGCSPLPLTSFFSCQAPQPSRKPSASPLTRSFSDL